VSPSAGEVQEITQEYGLDPTLAHDLITPTSQPRAEKIGNHLYLVLHFPTLQNGTGYVRANEQEVDFIIGEDVLITTRYDNLEAITEFRHVFSTQTDEDDESILGDNPLSLFSLLARRLYRGVEGEITVVREKLEYIEKEIFEGYEKEMVQALSYAGRDILNLKQALDPHQEILHSLIEIVGSVFNDTDELRRLRTVENIYYRARRHVIRLWQTLTELRETNNSLLTTKQNEVMKVFTILAFVTFPLSLVASIFGMNIANMPFADNPHGFWIIIAIMLASTGAMFLFFKKRRWL